MRHLLDERILYLLGRSHQHRQQENTRRSRHYTDMRCKVASDRKRQGHDTSLPRRVSHLAALAVEGDRF